MNWLVDNTFGLIFKVIFKILAYILPKEFSLIITEYSEMFWDGIKNTMYIALLATVLGFLIALVLGTLRTFKIKPNDNIGIKILKKFLNFVISIYVTVFRGTPMMVQAMIIYYGLVSILSWSPVMAGVFIVTINTGAYLTEVIKEAILSVDNGQYEAARSIGFSHMRTMVLFIYPQAIKNCMASIGNEFVINIKDTSVLNVIGCAEMYLALKISASVDYNYMQQMMVGALIYLFLTFTVTKILNFIQKKLDVPVKDIVSSN